MNPYVLHCDKSDKSLLLPRTLSGSKVGESLAMPYTITPALLIGNIIIIFFYSSFLSVDAVIKLFGDNSDWVK